MRDEIEREMGQAAKKGADGGNRLIRQAISCDICGTEKKQTNHWFVAYEQAGELRVSGWNARNRLRPGSRHLCGQTCLHKLVDDFMAKALSVRVPRTTQNDAEDAAMKLPAGGDTSLTSDAAYGEIESSARLISSPEPPAPVTATPARPPLRMPMELIALPPKAHIEEPAAAVNEPPRFASRNWHAAAWERERERELRSAERHPGAVERRYGS
jgi:hypothetical protein